MSIDPREQARAEWEQAGAPAPAPLRYKPFPVDDLGPAAAFVREGARVMRVDPAMIALPLLAGLASAVGNARCVELRSDWHEPAVLWTVIVARSGSMKSPAMDLALKPIRERQDRAMRRHAEAMERHEADLAAWKGAKSREPAPRAPTAERCIMDDTTIEALAARLAENWRGLLVAREELGAWFGSFNEYKAGKGSDAPKWLTMHGARPLTVDRASKPTIHIPRAAVCITGTIQPGPLRRALTVDHRESGMLARLLLAAPPEHPKRWGGAGIGAEAARGIAGIYDNLFALLPEIDASGAECPGIVRLSPDAERAWAGFYEAWDEERRGLPDDLAAAWAKLEGATARLALIHHLCRGAAGENIDPDTIDPASMVAGIGLVEWFAHEARRIYSMFAESEGEAERWRVVEWIRGRGGKVSLRDTMRGGPCFKTAEAAARALCDLERAGIGRWESPPPGPKGGAPAFVFRLTDSTDTDTTPHHDPENGGSVSVSSVGGVNGRASR